MFKAQVQDVNEVITTSFLKRQTQKKFNLNNKVKVLGQTSKKKDI